MLKSNLIRATEFRTAVAGRLKRAWVSDQVPFECLQKPLAWLRHPWAKNVISPTRFQTWPVAGHKRNIYLFTKTDVIITETRGAIHSTNIQTGPTGKRGPPQKVDLFFRNFSGWTEPIHWVLDRNFRKFWLNGSRPRTPTKREYPEAAPPPSLPLHPPFLGCKPDLVPNCLKTWQ